MRFTGEIPNMPEIMTAISRDVIIDDLSVERDEVAHVSINAPISWVSA
jgi:hypothetical protein